MARRESQSLLLPSNAYVPLDGRELEVASATLAEKATSLYNQGNKFEADQLLLLALKFKKTKKDFHELYQSMFERRYGLMNEEKPAGGQTFQGNI